MGEVVPLIKANFTDPFPLEKGEKETPQRLGRKAVCVCDDFFLWFPKQV